MSIVMHSRTLAMDAEANGLLEEVTKIWCICAEDVDTKEVFIYHDFPQFNHARVFDAFDKKEYIIPKRNGTLEEGVVFLMGAGKIVCHNYLGYDYFVIKKFFPKFNHNLNIVQDTFIQSKLQWFDRPTPKGCKGPHGLQAWGARQGINKPEVTDWTVMDAFKLHRCLQDISIQAATYRQLEAEKQKLENTVGASLDEAMMYEHRYRYYATKQELTGAPVDKEHMEHCVEELDRLSEELRIKIEPLLPMTVKYPTKATLHDVKKALGFKKLPPIKYEKKERAGEEKLMPVKEYYKPTTTFLKVLKGKIYSAVNAKLGVDTGFKFGKLKEAREWMKENYPEKKQQAGWKYPSEEANIELYNKNTCDYFDLEENDYNTREDFKVVGPFTKVSFSDSTMSQHAVVKAYLLSLGWKPTEWNYKKDPKGGFLRDDKGKMIPTSPKLTEDSFDSIEGDGVGKDIAHYNTYSHRRKFIKNVTDDSKGLLNKIREDGRVSCGINAFGTATGRSSHSNWVNAPGVGALYGEECRKIIIAEPKKLLVGADMKSAQLSIAAYYANNYDYYMAVADGQEVRKDEQGNEIYIGESGHCVNARMFELVSEEEWKRAVATQDPELLHHIMLQRKLSKGGTFATIFGASGKKIGTTLGIPEELGQEKKDAFLNNIGLDEPIRRLELMMAKNKRGKGGYLELPFGYYVFCSQKHKLFNYIDQGSEAACQKVAVLYFERELQKQIKVGNLEAEKILDYHDEFLVQSHEDCAEEVGKLMCESYQFASDAMFEWHKEKSQWFGDVSFPISLDGGFKVGTTYLATH